MKKIKVEPKVHNRLVKYKKKGYYDIIKYIGDHFTLVQVMHYSGNMNNDISVVEY